MLSRIKKNKKKYILPIILSVVILFLWQSNSVFAQTADLGLGYASKLKLGTEDVRDIVMNVINIATGFLGIIAIGIVLYGGYTYMTAGGDAGKIEDAKKILINGGVGTGLVLSSYSIAYFIINVWLGATGTGGGGSGGPIIPPPPPTGSGSSFAVSWVDPDNNESNVSLCRLVQVKFNQAIDLNTIDNVAGAWAGSFDVTDTTSLSDVNFQLSINGGAVAGTACTANTNCASGVCDLGGTNVCKGNLVPGAINSWVDKRGLTFNNTNDFEVGVTYRVDIISDAMATPGLQSSSLDYLSAGDYTSIFNTGSTTDTTPPTVSTIFPADASNDICLASVLQVGFSEPMDVASLLSTNSIDPMSPISNNSIFITPGIEGFKKSVVASTLLSANPTSLYTANTGYTPNLDSDVIRDSCGNYLDGNSNGTADYSAGGDDYSWNFATGTTIECTPEITSITPAEGYYGRVASDTVTINGNYFATAGDIFFNNGVDIVSIGDNSCFDSNYIPNQSCVVSWGNNSIDVMIPSGGGASNGAISGDVRVEVGDGNTSESIPFTVKSPHVGNVLPAEGGVDQFVTVKGINFDPTFDGQGADDHVYFKKKSDPSVVVEATYPCAGGIGWQDDEIIIAVPDSALFFPDEEWYIQVVIDRTAHDYWSNVNTFIFKDIEPGPGICSVKNIEAGSIYLNTAEGKLDETVQFSGVRFNDVNAPIEQDVLFGNYSSFVSGKNIAGWTYASPDIVSADVPNVVAGDVGVFLKIDGKNSNILNFKVHPTDAGPRIDYFEATSGPIGEYVTIYGAGFGKTKGTGNVTFSGINGDFNFPASCSGAVWKDNQIVVKVPTGATTGSITVINGSGLSDNTTDLVPSVFTITAGTPGPGVCKIEPVSGPLGTGVSLYGERFTGASDVKFFNNKSAVSFSIDSNEKISSAIVPRKLTADTADDAVSGDVVVVNGSNSNGYNFQVFNCKSAGTSCDDMFPSAGYQCCYDGSCSTNCFTPKESTYAWNFSTGTYTTCSGYSLNQCTVAQSCPNSPGQCSSSPTQTNVDTGKDCGNNYCNNLDQCKALGACSYSVTDNKCELGSSVCQISNTFVGNNVSCVPYSWDKYPRVAYWHFNEGANQTAYDSVNKNDAVILGASWVDGRFGKALGFADAPDNYIIKNPFNNFPEKELSVEFWIKTADNNAGLVSYATTFSDNEFTIAATASLSVAVGGNTAISTGVTVNDNNWHHIVATWRNSDGQIKVYKDGVDSFTGTSATGYNIVNGGSLVFAQEQDSVGGGFSSETFSGAIDEISIYDRVLVPSEVNARYLSGTKDYVWQYPLNGGCSTGSYQDKNGLCTIGSPVAPTLCGGCQDGFTCNPTSGGNGKCVINQTVCPDKTVCDTSSVLADGYNACRGDVPGSCECCCRVGYSDTDCCAGLTCVDDNCGTDDVVNTYGFCKGCAVRDGTTLHQDLSDSKCGCKSNTKICVVNGTNVNGVCNDCEDVGTDQTECGKHSACCWNGGTGKCGTCDNLQVTEQACYNTVDNGLVGYWKMDEINASNKIIDESGSGNDGTIVGVANLVNGAYSKGLSNFSANDYMIVSDSNSLDVSTDFTFSAWVKKNDTTSSGYIFTKDNIGGDNTGGYNFVVSGALPQLEINNVASTLSTTSIAEDVWQHITLTHSGNEYRFYINGIFSNTVINSNNPDILTSTLIFGRRGDNSDPQRMDGVIDEVRIYNRALTAEEVASLVGISSPSPYKDEDDVCINANILTKFNQNLDTISAQVGVDVVKCNAGGNFSATACTVSVDGVKAVTADPKILSFDPSANFSPNTWYQVTFDQDLKSAPAGLRLANNYVWHFKTTNSLQPCKPDSILVLPTSATLTKVDDTQNYSSYPMRQCNVLDPTSYGWGWQSSDSAIATITNDDATLPTGVDPVQVAKAKDKDGTTQIGAYAEGVGGQSPLTVFLENPLVSKYWPNCGAACLNASIGVEFNLPMDPGTLNTTNIKLYKFICGNGVKDAGEDCDDGNSTNGDGCSSRCLHEGSNLPLVSLDAEDGKVDVFSPVVDSVILDGSNKVYQRTNAQTFVSSDFIPVDPNNRYTLSGLFRSTLSSSVSMLYYGLVPYDENYEFISDWDVSRQGNDVVISSFNSTTITTNQAMSGWKTNTDWAGERSLGFYYDGDTSKTPDDVYFYYPTGGYDSMVAGDGAYSNDVSGGTVINLNHVLPVEISSRIVSGLTVVKNHLGGGTYMYSAVANVMVPTSWTEYKEDNITGEGFGNDADVFRLGTKYVKLIILANYNQSGGETLQFDDLKFTEATNSCGNGVVDLSEDCDAKPFPNGCDKTTCLHTGSATGFAVCGDGNVGEGEDCDGGSGCSVNCLNEGTNIIEGPLSISVAPNLINKNVDINLSSGAYFEPNTYYRAFFTENIKSLFGKSLSGLNYDFINKDGINDSFSWSFSTKDKFCAPSVVNVDPSEKTIYSINASQSYQADVLGSPDECNNSGQKLNAYSYNWTWSSLKTSVATITPVNSLPSCGDGKIELGEDCDDGNIKSGDGCSGTESATACLNEGTAQTLNLIEHWKLDEGTDIFTKDSIVGLSGELKNGAKWTDGKIGNAIQFDRPSYVDIGGVATNPLVNNIGSSDFSITAWVRLNVDLTISVPGGTNYEIFSNEDYQDFGYLLRVNGTATVDSGRIHFRTSNLSSVPTTANVDSLDGAYPNDNEWHHIAITKNATVGKIYLDGVLLDTTGSLINPANSTINASIGGQNPQYWVGAIDDFRFYKSALTGSQVVGIMKQEDYVCGNGVVDFGEDCDGGLGCNTTCVNTGSVPLMATCGNSIIEIGEDCDDGNATPNDGCSATCLNEGTKTDSYVDYIQTAITRSPGTTDIMASVNYCSDKPTYTCSVGATSGAGDGSALDCHVNTAGACVQTSGTGKLDVVCGYKTDLACSQGVCDPIALRCTNNGSKACTVLTESVDCNLSAPSDQTCGTTSPHTCSLEVWGGTCSADTSKTCHADSDCSGFGTCTPSTDCNYCNNNNSIECRANIDCNIGVGYDSCCYSRPKIENKSPDPSYFDALNVNCNGATNPDSCSALPGSICETYTCNNNKCSAYGKCRYGVNTLDLVGYWKLNETTGTVANDSSLKNHDGTLTGGSWVAGKVGQAVKFPSPIGSNYITINDNDDFDFGAGSFSLQAWFNPDNATTHHRLITKGAPFSVGGSGYSLLYYTSGSYNYGRLQLNDGGSECDLTSDHLGDVHNKWTNISVVFDSIKKEVRWYINGKPFGVSTTIKNSCLGTIGNISNDQPLYLGYSGAYGLEGLLDDVRIYKRAIDVTDVHAAYEDGFSTISCLNDSDCPSAPDNSPVACDKSCTTNADCNDIVCGACRNAQVNIVFDQLMDAKSFNTDGVCSNSGTQSCSQDSECGAGICLKNIRLGVKYDNAVAAQKACPTGYYSESGLVYQPEKQSTTFIGKIINKIKLAFNKVKMAFNNFIGKKEIVASPFWCAIPGNISSFDSNNKTTAVFTPQGLQDNLFDPGLNYQVTIKDKVKSLKGVAKGVDEQFQFEAGDVQCEVNAVEIYVSE